MILNQWLRPKNQGNFSLAGPSSPEFWECSRGGPGGRVVLPAGAYSAARNRREGQFRGSLAATYRSRSLANVTGITKRRFSDALLLQGPKGAPSLPAPDP
jgi:hypothetical protein